MATNDINQKWFEKALDQDKLSRAEYLWTEFQYRHDLIWNLVFRLTIAVVLLGIIPYTQSQLIEGLGEFLSLGVLAPPLLGAVLALVGFNRIRHELKQLAYIWGHYRPLQDHLLDIPFRQKSILRQIFRQKSILRQKSTFPRDVKIYTVFLTVLAGLNIPLAGFYISCDLKIPLLWFSSSWCSSLGF
jgi:hypothetical protein